MTLRPTRAEGPLRGGDRDGDTDVRVAVEDAERSHVDLTPAREGVGWRYYLRAVGPGLVTGASDDDPSGIATYSQAGRPRASRCCGRPG